MLYLEKKQESDGLKFEWDQEKNLINQKKHKISFETAAYVFADKNYIEMYDFEHSIDEDRIHCDRMCWRSTICCVYGKKREYSFDFRQTGNRIREEALLCSRHLLLIRDKNRQKNNYRKLWMQRTLR